MTQVSPSSQTPRKTLMIRLSSLGDVILASAALTAAERRQSPSQIHWVVSREYASLLRGHPAIHRLWEFDRSTGFLGWLKLCEKLWQEGFSEVIDLHSTLRSKLAKLYFFVRSKLASSRLAKTPMPEWRTLDKQRIRLYGYFIFRALWPEDWRPGALVEKFSKVAGGDGSERPDLSHLLRQGASLPEDFLAFASRPYLVVMPSSRWEGKKWPVRQFLQCLLKFGMPVVVLGGREDRESQLLIKLLEQSGHPFYPGVAVFDFVQLALVIERSEGFLGNDTGLAHLAEAVGKPVTTVFGPTVPEMGFGPWRSESRSVRSSLWCSPCGKDGRFCFRVNDRFACLQQVSADEVVKNLRAMTRV
ncbi:MAG: glycosyltransferase family 9 protein [Oligoflexia bacterium]|nr:glycosyltransferase family 9 protein [Oligoflexia bacterium]